MLWMRRHDLKDKSARFLITGFIGLKGVVKKLGLHPSVNAFDPLVIVPLTEAGAIGLLEKP